MAVNKKITELDEIVTPVEGDKLLIIDVSEADDNDKPKQVDFIDFKGDTGEQGIQGIQGVQGDDGQGVPYALDTGSANAYAIDVSSDPLSYTAGDIYSFKASNANTGASTLNVDTLGAKTIKKNVSDDLETGDILANQIITVIYDGTNFQVVSGSGSAETATTIGALIGGADNATPNNTDFVATSLTAGGILKKITWTNVKAFLKTYFDTLYGSLTSQETGWNSAGETWTFSSVDNPTGVITVPSDATDKYSAGMRISFVNGGNTIYGIITAVTSTTITFLHEIDPTDSEALHLMANSAITVPKYSTQKAPFGFPLNPDKWSIIVDVGGEANQASPSAGVWYNIGSGSVNIPIGCWNVSLLASISVRLSINTAYYFFQSSLSTANNTQGTADWTRKTRWRSGVTVSGNQFTDTIFLNGTLDLTTKDTYYINFSSDSAGMILLETIEGSVVRAVCAYL